jgi:hypothetical protein
LSQAGHGEGIRYVIQSPSHYLAFIIDGERSAVISSKRSKINNLTILLPKDGAILCSTRQRIYQTVF